MLPSKAPQKNSRSNSSNWMRYLSYGIQLMATIGIGLYLGYLADRLLGLSFPLLIWILPTLLLVYMLVKLVKDFSGKGKDPKP